MNGIATDGRHRHDAGDGALPPPHPNDLDRRRLERALARRQRYRYVKPRVLQDADGLRVVSPNCSRKVDREGGCIDIARLCYAVDTAQWRLFFRDHDTARWFLGSESDALDSLLHELCVDPQRRYWP